jgi:hypothetical protein
MEGKFDEAMTLYWEMARAMNTLEKFTMPMVESGSYNFLHSRFITARSAAVTAPSR